MAGFLFHGSRSCIRQISILSNAWFNSSNKNLFIADRMFYSSEYGIAELRPFTSSPLGRVQRRTLDTQVSSSVASVLRALGNNANITLARHLEDSVSPLPSYPLHIPHSLPPYGFITFACNHSHTLTPVHSLALFDIYNYPRSSPRQLQLGVVALCMITSKCSSPSWRCSISLLSSSGTRFFPPPSFNEGPGGLQLSINFEF